VTPQSYQATLNALLGLDVEVRFGDIDPETLCLNPASVEALLDQRTRAVFLTHYGGLMVRMDRLNAVLSGRDVLVVEDCAHAHGSSFKGRMAGAFGNIGCYSFQSMKNMSTLGQGGMLLLPDARMAERARSIIAVEPDATFSPKVPSGILGPYLAGPQSVLTHEKNAFAAECISIARHGTNSTLTEPSAAVGRVQLKRLPEFLAQRKKIANTLDTLLSAIPGIRPQHNQPDFVHSHHLYTCFCEDRIDNQTVAEAMVRQGIEVQQRYFPLHLLPEWRFRGGRLGQCPIAESIWFKHQLNLPINPSLTDAQIEYMADALREVMAQL
jgi:perosamine synthetase